MGPKAKRRRGHSCWCCRRHRPNEAFSGGGHARHLCRDCAKLGRHELSFRQAERDMERAMGFSPPFPRRARALLERFLTHENARVREYAAELLEQDRKERAELREETERACEEYMSACAAQAREEQAWKPEPEQPASWPGSGPEELELPF